MSVLIFRLNNVGDDEAEDVRALLEEHGFDCYETSAGMFGLAVAGIWLKDESRKAEARAVIDAYQEERGKRIRSELEFTQPESIFERIVRAPSHYIALIIAAAIVLYLSLAPFIGFLG